MYINTIVNMYLLLSRKKSKDILILYPTPGKWTSHNAAVAGIIHLNMHFHCLSMQLHFL